MARVITDPHDPRTFRRYITFSEDGTVAASHDVEAGVIPPADLIDVTDHVPMDLSAILIKPSLVTTLRSAITDKDQAVAGDAVRSAVLLSVSAIKDDAERQAAIAAEAVKA